MQVVIYTQHRENYGTASNPCWKFKGGSTFVVQNLSVEHTLKIKESGLPTLRSLIESRDEGFQESVIDFAILDDGEKVCEEYETPTFLFYKNGRWSAGRAIENNEYGCMRQEIARKVEAWDMLDAGGRENYKCHYILREDGRAVDHEGLCEYLGITA